MAKTNTVDMASLMQETMDNISKKKTLKDTLGAGFTLVSNSINALNDEIVMHRYKNVPELAQAQLEAMEALEKLLNAKA